MITTTITVSNTHTGEVQIFSDFATFAAWFNAANGGLGAQYYFGEALYNAQNAARCSDEKRARQTVAVGVFEVAFEVAEIPAARPAPMLVRYKTSMGGIAETTACTTLAELYALPKRRRPTADFVIDEQTGKPVLVDCCISDTCNCFSHPAIQITRMEQGDNGVWGFVY